MSNKGSLYDQFSENEAPAFNTETPHANRADTTKPYVNGSPKAREAMQTSQEDFSYYAWWRLVTSRQPNNGFEQSVNIAFKGDNGIIDGKNYDDMRSKYISKYKKMLAEL